METSGAFDTLTGTGRALAIAALLATSGSIAEKGEMTP